MTERTAPPPSLELPSRIMLKTAYGSVDRSSSVSEKAVEGVQKRREMDEEAGPTSQGPITFADLGIPSATQLQDTVVGKARPCSDISWKERLYVSLMILSIIAVVIFTIYRVATASISDPDFTFGLVLLLNAVFCAWFVIEGVLRERPSELLILSIATVIVLVYLIVNYAAGLQNDIKLARLIIACIFCPILVLLGFNIAWEYHVSGHLIFRTVGASEMLQTLYRRLLFFQDFLKFDLELGGSMVILIVSSRLDVSTRDIIILSVGGVVTLAWFVLGFVSMSRESMAGAVIFFLFSPAEVAYICYKMYDVSKYADDYSGLEAATIACGAAALVIRFIVVVGGILVCRGFGEGLKDKLK